MLRELASLPETGHRIFYSSGYLPHLPDESMFFPLKSFGARAGGLTFDF
jgi:hypothetical protein